MNVPVFNGLKLNVMFKRASLAIVVSGNGFAEAPFILVMVNSLLSAPLFGSVTVVVSELALFETKLTVNVYPEPLVTTGKVPK